MTIQINQARISRFAKSVSYVNALDVKQKVVLSDVVFEKQPELLLEVVGLSKLGVPPEKLEHLFNLLFIFFDYFHERGKVELPKVTEQMMDKASTNTQAMLKLMDKEDLENGLRLLEKEIGSYPEVEALAYFFDHIKQNGFVKFSKENEICLRTGKMLLDCFTHVKQLNQNEARQQRAK